MSSLKARNSQMESGTAAGIVQDQAEADPEMTLWMFRRELKTRDYRSINLRGGEEDGKDHV